MIPYPQNGKLIVISKRWIRTVSYCHRNWSCYGVWSRGRILSLAPDGHHSVSMIVRHSRRRSAAACTLCRPSDVAKLAMSGRLYARALVEKARVWVTKYEFLLVRTWDTRALRPDHGNGHGCPVAGGASARPSRMGESSWGVVSESNKRCPGRFVVVRSWQCAQACCRCSRADRISGKPIIASHKQNTGLGRRRSSLLNWARIQRSVTMVPFNSVGDHRELSPIRVLGEAMHIRNQRITRDPHMPMQSNRSRARRG